MKEVTISSANTDLKQELVGSDDGGSGSKTTELDVKII